MAQCGAAPCGEDSRHPPPLNGQAAVTHGVHAAVHRMESPPIQPLPDASSAQPQLDQLRPTDHAVLPRGRAKDVELRLLHFEVVRFTYRQVTDRPEAVAAKLRVLLSRPFQ